MEYLTLITLGFMAITFVYGFFQLFTIVPPANEKATNNRIRFSIVLFLFFFMLHILSLTYP